MSLSHRFPPGPSVTDAERQWKLKQESATPHKFHDSEMKHYLKKAITISNTFLRGGVVCRSAELSLLCPFMWLYLSLFLPLTLCVRSNEWQSGDVVLIYCMVAQMEPGRNMSVTGASLRKKHLLQPGTTKSSIREGFPPEQSVHCTYVHNGTVRYAVESASKAK